MNRKKTKKTKKKASGHLVWIVSGPSGSGKTSLCDSLLEDALWRRRLMRSVSYTTRPLRRGEEEGRDYHRISEKRFLELKKKGAFLESEKIFGFYYGTHRKVVEEARRKGKDLLLCIDVKGARTVKKALSKNAFSIFVLAPEIKTLNERLSRRSTESRCDIKKRLERVKMELSHAKEYDYVVVNDDFKRALEKIKAILTAKRCEETHAIHSLGKTYR